MELENGTIRHLRKSMNFPGHAHELTSTCYNGYKLLSRDQSRQWFVDALDRARRKHALQLWCYVIMPEHVHAIVLPEREHYEMEEILKSVKQSVSRRAMSFLRATNPFWLEKLTVRQPGGKVECHFWQPGGGYDRNMISNRALYSAVQYIHANPVRRGLVRNPLDWEWSSARWWEGATDVPLQMDASRFLSF